MGYSFYIYQTKGVEKMNNLFGRSGRSGRFFKRNSSTILTCVGAAGVVATSIMAVKATPKAITLLEQAEDTKGGELTTLEKIQVVGTVYIPAITVGISTILCIFGANALNKKQQASLVSAYTLLNNSYSEFKRKANELYGEETEDRIYREIAKDRYDEDRFFSEGDQVLFFDNHSMRYFESTIEHVQRAEYNLNRKLSIFDYVSVNDYYELLGIPGIESGDEIGWSTGMNFEYYWHSWIDFDHDKVIMDDGLECYIISFRDEPAAGYENY